MPKVIIKDQVGNISTEIWTKVSYFCPRCGARNLYKGDHRDYIFLCLNCKGTFYILRSDFNKKEQALEQIERFLNDPRPR